MDSLATSVNKPKMSYTTLEIKKNYYVIPDGEKFHYFPIKIKDEKTTRPIFRFEKSPPVIMEGIAIIDSKLYHVPVQDLLRGIIRKSKEIQPANRVSENGSSNTTIISHSGTTSPTAKSTFGVVGDLNGANLQYSNESATVDPTTLEINSAANLAWTDQIDSLLSFISEKEGCEWEIACVAQP
jgi:hypothetical protein